MGRETIHARPWNQRRPWLLHLFRALLLAALVWLVRDQHQWYRAQVQGRQQAALDIEQVRPFLPQAARLVDGDRQPALSRVEDASGHLVGFAGRTSPAADDLIGFQGPSDTLDGLATLDPAAAGIEGVSGATMTSKTVAGLVAAILLGADITRGHGSGIRLFLGATWVLFAIWFVALLSSACACDGRCPRIRSVGGLRAVRSPGFGFGRAAGSGRGRSAAVECC